MEIKQCGYQDWKFEKDSVIYCDPPYKGTAEYVSGEFDHNAFYDWAENQKNIFISEYSMPENRFKQIASFKKRSLLGAKGPGRIKEECIFIPVKNNFKRDLFDCIEG